MSPESLVKVLHSCVSNGGLSMSDCLMDTIKSLMNRHTLHGQCVTPTTLVGNEQGMFVDDAEPMLTATQGTASVQSK
eukprot:1129601-Amphidinium_carterae.2